jgi:hypothetical protein
MADISLRAVESSNLPASQKSAFARWYDSSVGKYSGGMARAKKHVVGTGAAVRKGGEGLIVGAVLGAASAHLKGGLDMKLTATSATTIPLDAAGGALLLGASILWAHEEVAPDLANAGANAWAVFGFRKTEEYMNKAKGGATVTGEGDFGEDPIIRLARRL